MHWQRHRELVQAPLRVKAYVWRWWLFGGVAPYHPINPERFIGHNPLARIGVALLFLLLLAQVVTGLVLAGTDLLWPPFGRLFAEWIAAPGVDPASVQPGASELIDKAAYQSMRAFRAPFVEVHEISFYALAAAIVVHLVAVVVTELQEGGSITSAMFDTHKKAARRLLIALGQALGGLPGLDS